MRPIEDMRRDAEAMLNFPLASPTAKRVAQDVLDLLPVVEERDELKRQNELLRGAIDDFDILESGSRRDSQGDNFVREFCRKIVDQCTFALKTPDEREFDVDLVIRWGEAQEELDKLRPVVEGSESALADIQRQITACLKREWRGSIPQGVAILCRVVAAAAKMREACSEVSRHAELVEGEAEEQGWSAVEISRMVIERMRSALAAFDAATKEQT